VQTDAPVLTGWQLDALLRRRALENAEGAQDTLKSIVKLVDQIENMPVGQNVKGDVQDSLTALDQVYQLDSFVAGCSPTIFFRCMRQLLRL
jgi:phosphatidylinositol glycan class S